MPGGPLDMDGLTHLPIKIVIIKKCPKLPRIYRSVIPPYAGKKSAINPFMPGYLLDLSCLDLRYL